MGTGRGTGTSGRQGAVMRQAGLHVTSRHGSAFLVFGHPGIHTYPVDRPVAQTAGAPLYTPNQTMDSIAR